jgi:hypothetical protein
MGHEGLDWLYLCYGGLDLAVANLAGAYAALEQLVKGSNCSSSAGVVRASGRASQPGSLAERHLSGNNAGASY